MGQTFAHNTETRDLLRNRSRKTAETTVYRSYGNDWKISLVHKGRFGEKWSSDASVNYNFYKDDSRRSYEREAFSRFSDYKDTKKYLNINASAQYALGDKTELDFGTSFTHARYKSDVRMKEDSDFSLRNTRSESFLYIRHNFSETLSLSLGAVGRYAGLGEGNKSSLLPELRLDYMPTESLRFHLEYGSRPAYPKLHELSPGLYHTDSLTIRKGNRDLYSYSPSHNVDFTADFGEFLSLRSYTEYCSGQVMPYYGLNEKNIVECGFSQGKFFQTSVNLSGYIMLLPSLSWSNSVQFNRFETGENKSNAWIYDSQLNYFHMPSQFAVGLEYHRNMLKIPDFQGFYDMGQDYWMISVDKSFFRNRLSFSLTYLPPLKWGVREEQKTTVVTPFYRSVQGLKLNTYRNMIFFRASFRFHRGKEIKRIRNKDVFDKETRRERGLL